MVHNQRTTSSPTATSTPLISVMEYGGRMYRCSLLGNTIRITVSTTTLDANAPMKRGRSRARSRQRRPQSKNISMAVWTLHTVKKLIHAPFQPHTGSWNSKRSANAAANDATITSASATPPTITRGHPVSFINAFIRSDSSEVLNHEMYEKF